MQSLAEVAVWALELGGHSEGRENAAVDAQRHSREVRFTSRMTTLAPGHTEGRSSPPWLHGMRDALLQSVRIYLANTLYSRDLLMLNTVPVQGSGLGAYYSWLRGLELCV